jgi:hypothetical protein
VKEEKDILMMKDFQGDFKSQLLAKKYSFFIFTTGLRNNFTSAGEGKARGGGICWRKNKFQMLWPSHQQGANLILGFFVENIF